MWIGNIPFGPNSYLAAMSVTVVVAHCQAAQTQTLPLENCSHTYKWDIVQKPQDVWVSQPPLPFPPTCSSFLPTPPNIYESGMKRVMSSRVSSIVSTHAVQFPLSSHQASKSRLQDDCESNMTEMCNKCIMSCSLFVSSALIGSRSGSSRHTGALMQFFLLSQYQIYHFEFDRVIMKNVVKRKINK